MNYPACDRVMDMGEMLAPLSCPVTIQQIMERVGVSYGGCYASCWPMRTTQARACHNHVTIGWSSRKKGQSDVLHSRLQQESATELLLNYTQEQIQTLPACLQPSRFQVLADLLEIGMMGLLDGGAVLPEADIDASRGNAGAHTNLP